MEWALQSEPEKYAADSVSTSRAIVAGKHTEFDVAKIAAGRRVRSSSARINPTGPTYGISSRFRSTSETLIRRPCGLSSTPTAGTVAHLNGWRCSACGNRRTAKAATAIAQQPLRPARRQTIPRDSCRITMVWRSPWKMLTSFGNGERAGIAHPGRSRVGLVSWRAGDTQER